MSDRKRQKARLRAPLRKCGSGFEGYLFELPRIEWAEESF